jgi:HSP20 family protein
MYGLIPFKTNNLQGRGYTVDDLFSDFFNDDFIAPLNKEASKFSTDIKENENEYVVIAELSGVKKEDINVEFKNDQLVISAKRQECKDESKDSYIRKERSYGEFQRAFRFTDVDNKAISAKFENGELKVIVPKKIKENEASKISVQ